MNEELFHQVTPFPQSSLAPTAFRTKSKPFVLKSKAFHRLAPDGLINSVFPPPSAVNYQLQWGWSALSSLPHQCTHTAPQKDKGRLLYLPVPLVSFTWNSLAASYPSLNSMWTSRALTSGRIPWPSKPTGPSSSPAPSCYSVWCRCDDNYGLSFQAVIHPSPREGPFSLSRCSFSLLPLCPSTTSSCQCPLVSCVLPLSSLLLIC